MAAIGDSKLIAYVVDQYHGARIPLTGGDALGLPEKWPDFGPVVQRSGRSRVVRVDYKPTIAPRTNVSDLANLAPYRARIGITLHQGGGGAQQITVRFAQRRPNPVDAQAVCFLLGAALTQTDAVTLYASGVAYKDCWVTSVTCRWRPIVYQNQYGKTSCAAVVEGELSLDRPLDASAVRLDDSGDPPPPWPLVASHPPEGVEAQWYVALPNGRAKLGRYADLDSVTFTRPSVVRELPRLYGARLSTVGYSYAQVAQGFDGRRGRQCAVNMRVWFRSVEDVYGAPISHPVQGSTVSHDFAIESQIEEFHHAVRDLPGWLTHHGIIIGPCFLESFSVDRRPRYFKTVVMNARFAVDVSVPIETPAEKQTRIAIT